jgi:RNA polymerase sigma-32 factor
MTTEVMKLTSMAPGADLDAYLRTISQFPILTPEEERSLAHRLHDEGDLAAARELVMCHLRFVVHLARSYKGYGLSQADLIQEGNVGLMKAGETLRPNRWCAPDFFCRALDQGRDA